MAIDIILLIFAGWGFYVGYSRGIIKTIFAILSLLFGLLAGLKFAPAASEFLKTVFNSTNPLLFIAGFLLAFTLTMILIRMLAKGLEGILKTARINILNKIMGGLLISGTLIIVFSSILWFAVSAHILDQNVAQQDSKSFPYLIQVPEQVSYQIKQLKPIVIEFWERSMEMMDDLQKSADSLNAPPTQSIQE